MYIPNILGFIASDAYFYPNHHHNSPLHGTYILSQTYL